MRTSCSKERTAGLTKVRGNISRVTLLQVAEDGMLWLATGRRGRIEVFAGGSNVLSLLLLLYIGPRTFRFLPLYIGART